MATPTTQAATPAAPSVFNGIEETMGKLPNVPAGIFKARVDAVKKVQSTKDASQVYFVVELTLTESNVPSMPVGTKTKRVIGTKPHPTYGTKYNMPEVKSLISAIIGEDVVTAQTGEAICSPKNPAAGRLINIVAKDEVKTKGKHEGKTFTRYSYSSAQ